jgi:hypothetical protein
MPLSASRSALAIQLTSETGCIDLERLRDEFRNQNHDSVYRLIPASTRRYVFRCLSGLGVSQGSCSHTPQRSDLAAMPAPDVSRPSAVNSSGSASVESGVVGACQGQRAEALWEEAPHWRLPSQAIGSATLSLTRSRWSGICGLTPAAMQSLWPGATGCAHLSGNRP